MQQLYLVGYDIGDPKRQSAIRYSVKNHSASGQKSAYECLLSSTDKQQLTDFASSKIINHDSFFIIKTIRTYFSQVSYQNQYDPSTATNHFYFG